MNIYQSFEKPVMSLAPMEDVTDTVFRQIVASVGRPDIFYTEFVNVEGLNSDGKESIIHRLKYDPLEKPIVAQLWGVRPENFFKGAKLVKELGFDGVDINMGCSVKKVVSKYAGSGMMNVDRSLVKEVIHSVKDGADGLPVSVKTRLGWLYYDLEWLGFLLDQDLDVLTLHARTATGYRSKRANWGRIEACSTLRDEMSKKTLIFGNGDILSLKSARFNAKKYKADGVMIGRGAINNPWIFSDRGGFPISESYEVFRKHILLFKETWGNTKDFNILKKFVKSYVSGFTGSNEIRKDLMDSQSIDDMLSKVEALLV